MADSRRFIPDTCSRKTPNASKEMRLLESKEEESAGLKKDYSNAERL